MNIRKPYYREFRRRFYETLGDKGDSILRYRGADNKEHYIATYDNPEVVPGGGMLKTTWAELKALRDAGELAPGRLYRITDYTTTTVQEDTRAMGNDFDVVVLALTERTLSEDAWAIATAGDTYFSHYEDEKGYVVELNELMNFMSENGIPLPPLSPRYGEGSAKYLWPEVLEFSYKEIIEPATMTALPHDDLGNLFCERDSKLDCEFDGANGAPLGYCYGWIKPNSLINKAYFTTTLDIVPGVTEVYSRLTTPGRPFPTIVWKKFGVVSSYTPEVSNTVEKVIVKKNALSQWRLKYSLDNDTARFAWADDSVDETVEVAFINISGLGINYYRDSEKDYGSATRYYAWTHEDGVVLSGTPITVYTRREDPLEGDNLYDASSRILEPFVTSFTPAHEGSGEANGRGVIYRMIDEHGNDLPFDFKNIQFSVWFGYDETLGYEIPFGGGDGYSDWRYAFTLLLINNEITDATLQGIAKDNIILSNCDNGDLHHYLPCVIFFRSYRKQGNFLHNIISCTAQAYLVGNTQDNTIGNWTIVYSGDSMCNTIIHDGTDLTTDSLLFGNIFFPFCSIKGTISGNSIFLGEVNMLYYGDSADDADEVATIYYVNENSINYDELREILQNEYGLTPQSNG